MNELLIILKSGWDFRMLVVTVLEIQLGGDAKEGQGQRTVCVLSGSIRHTDVRLHSRLVHPPEHKLYLNTFV